MHHAPRTTRHAPCDALLAWGFMLALALRFLWPFYWNPHAHRFSDPGRHWVNAELFLTPHMFNAIDPKLYQLYLFLIQKIALGQPAVFALTAGLLSVGCMLAWYRACRELFPRRAAKLLAIVIGAHPSMWVIYGYFMNETLALPILGSAVWLSLRAVRKDTPRAHLLAALVLVLACYTRMQIVPVAMLLFAWQLLNARQWRRMLVGGAAMLALSVVPTGFYAYKAVNVFAPFHFPYFAEYNFYSGTAKYQLKSNMGFWEYSAPSFYTNPFDPFASFDTERSFEPNALTVDTKNGMDDWERGVREYRERLTNAQLLRYMYENAVFFIFSPSWPDSSERVEMPVHLFNYWLRWMWPPLIFAALLYYPFVRLPRAQAAMTALLFAWLMACLLQTSAVMEGRYRKPVEPFVLMVTFAVYFRRRGDGVNVLEFIYESLSQAAQKCRKSGGPCQAGKDGVIPSLPGQAPGNGTMGG